MKKFPENRISKKLREVDGGVCAPAGFRAGGAFCDSDDYFVRRTGFSMVVADRRCPAACVYASGATVAASSKLMQKHLKYGLSQAFFANNGIANSRQPQGEQFAKNVCGFVERCGIADAADVMIASTGRMSGRLDLPLFENGVLALKDSLSVDGSSRAAEALAANGSPQQAAYSFELGNYVCKIGAIFKGGAEFLSEMPTIVGAFTTDANISSEMLRKALQSGFNESFRLLNVNDVYSPNDMVCVMASGKAGNYKIDREDTEYKKFAFALAEVMKECCRRIVADGMKKTLFCHVCNAKSKTLARLLARKLVGSYAFKLGVETGDLKGECILGMLSEYRELEDSAEIRIRSENGELVLFSDGVLLSCEESRKRFVLSARKAELCVFLNEGNFSATAYGCLY